MIAVDTNVLVYAHRADSAWHDAARAAIARLAEGVSPWALPWPCVHEFLAIATHPQIFSPPTSVTAALDQIEAWLESPSVVLLAESAGYWTDLRATLDSSRVIGPQVHDARVAALCLQHGVSELWTADRDFNRFANLVARNPLVG